MVRPDLIKDSQDLKGKKLGVTAVNGGDHIIGRELLRMKGLDPSLVQAIAVGEPSLRAQAVLSNVVQAVSVSPPHDLMLQQMGLKAISGPPEIGVPSSGLFAADRLIKENPQILRRTIRAALRANRFIEENREETIRIMTRFVPQSLEAATRSYDVEFKALAKDGQMTDAEIEFQLESGVKNRGFHSLSLLICWSAYFQAASRGPLTGKSKRGRLSVRRSWAGIKRIR